MVLIRIQVVKHDGVGVGFVKLPTEFRCIHGKELWLHRPSLDSDTIYHNEGRGHPTVRIAVKGGGSR